ncbi:MAG: hypothetical protein GX765_00160 [Candidatus Moranbacteria bacterium]|nr:hypothetical protein [Candidatus Moranbacteria bacterium]
MSENPLDFYKKLKKELKNRLKIRELKPATILIFIMGCFFYLQLGLLTPAPLKAESFSYSDQELQKKISENIDFKSRDDFALQKKVREEVLAPEIIVKNNLEEEIKSITKNHPIEEMAPFIAEYDKKIAALIVGIAKKESNWGIHSPSKNGQTCYNYWGYKGAGSRGTALGYGCFSTPEEAVAIIGKRIDDLAQKRIDTPQKMVVWKCGSSCAGHDPAGVNKWISDVSIYYNKINNVPS